MTNTRSILLAYATRYGSTQEVAEAIAAELQQAGLKVKLQPMREVAAVDNYAAIVLGAAIYNAKWHPDAHHFLMQHQEGLSQRTVAIFALGPLNASSAAMRNSRHQLDMELAKHPWLRPIAIEMFVGKMDPTKLSFLDRLGARASDNRDWDAIRSWSQSLTAQLRQTLLLQTAA